MIDPSGAQVGIDYLHSLIHEGKLFRVSHMATNVATSTGYKYLINVPAGVELHYEAKYFAKFGGWIKATYDPAVTANGTEVVASNLKTNSPVKITSKFYAAPTATAKADAVPFYVGIPGGTGVAGTGSSGGNGERVELGLRPGNWLLEFTPYADSSDFIINVIAYEE